MENNEQQINNEVTSVVDDVETVDDVESVQLHDPAEQPTQGTGTVTKRQKNKVNKIVDIALWVIIAVLAIAVVLRAFVFTNITIEGKSMTADYYNEASSPYYNTELTYHDGQTVRVIKVAKPERGDVVVFYKNQVSKLRAFFAFGDEVRSGGEYEKLIKRVVALEGDKLWLEPIADTEGQYRVVILPADGSDKLYEDYYEKGGKKLDLDAFVLNTHTASGLGILADCTEDNPFVVSANHFFAMGDNRANSSDSRSEGLGEVPMSQLYGVVRG